ncbi:replicative DNA helicase [Sorangium sp. So ce296]|uniref:replicative DNA helicase n=1 Tax=Sorangium sp. So ce296 TaxID=3133296 RepID=UPI003F60C26A
MNVSRVPHLPRLRPIKGRVPPHNLDAEAVVLSALLEADRMVRGGIFGRDEVERVFALLKPEHFYSDPNRFVYEAILALREAGTPSDIVAVANELRNQDRFEAVGKDYLPQLADATAAVFHVEAHAELVVAKWVQRTIGALGHRVAAESYGDVGEVAEWIASIQRDLYELSSVRRAPAGEYLSTILQRLFRAKEENPAAGAGEGIRTGYLEYDRKTLGLRAGQLRIVAGRPGSGKSSWARGLAVNATKTREPVQIGAAVFSMEMTRDEVSLGMLFSEAHVDGKLWASNQLQEKHWSQLTSAAAVITQLGLIVDDTPALTLAELRSRVLRYASEFDRPAEGGQRARRLAVVVVDYLQLMKGSGKPGLSRQQELGEISRGLKALAKELQICVVALAQMNREAEKQRRRPQMSDLRESGDLEADADEVTFIHQAPDDDARPAPARRGGGAGHGQDVDDGPEKGVAEIIIRKQRGGETGMIRMRWFGECTRFVDLSPREAP